MTIIDQGNPESEPAERRDAPRRYLTGIPRKPLPEGQVVVHNFPPGYEGRPVGYDGWRIWRDDRHANPRYVLCECGWAADRLGEHYNVRRGEEEVSS